MKLQKALWVPAIAALGMTSLDAAAIGTEAGTSIANRATLTFSSGSGNTTQETVSSKNGNDADAPTTFLVDIKVNFVLSRIYNDTLTKQNDGATDDPVLGFQLSNLSNASVDFNIGAIADVVTGTAMTDTDVENASNVANLVDNFDVTTYGSGSTARTFKYYLSEDDALDTSTDTEITTDKLTGYISADDTGTANTNLDNKVYIFVVADDENFIGDDAAIGIVETEVTGVTASYSGTSGVSLTTEDTDGNDNDAVEVVYADADGNNSETHQDAVELFLPQLELIKTSAVYSDPLNGTSSPYAIPGAVVVYQLQVKNTGRADASGIDVTDPLDLDVTFYETATGDYSANQVKLQTTALTDASTITANFDAATAINAGSSADQYSNTPDGTTYSSTIVVNDLTIAGKSEETVFISVTID
ncbi:DUF11 domain-containing protein [Oceanobacter kriegii]|uniref:DUF11 domain-containing protein n=1 Tax=Oceanobacter kriegii TaxID=64972 RepID=UPI000413B845|nr:DUF11 domain-containing protein [Oceanobacter kriegii]